jgi:hypothetical protein
MSRYRQVFAGRRTVLPVIHVESTAQAQRNARIARDAGADGVFLISHGKVSDLALLDLQGEVAEAHPGWWVGVNCLGLSAEEVFATVTPKVNGVWTDNARIDETKAEQPYAERVTALRRRVPDCLYFGGVAFKYQRNVNDLEAACRAAVLHLDVVTTSGSGTGRAAHLEKIRRMSQALAGHPLALASGITPDNVGEFLPYVDCYLVATGISVSFTELDPAKTRSLVEQAHGYSIVLPSPKAQT